MAAVPDGPWPISQEPAVARLLNAEALTAAGYHAAQGAIMVLLVHGEADPAARGERDIALAEGFWWGRLAQR